MAEVKWIKIVTDIFDDEKILMIESLPERDGIIVIWFKLLCLAGKTNTSGVLIFNDRIPYTDEMLATIFRRPLNTVRLALSTFENYGMIEIVNDTITIPKWDKHQQLDALELSREQTRKRVQAFRDRQKEIACNVAGNVTEGVTVTQCNADRIRYREDKDKDNNISSEKLENEFAELWKMYPRKDGKANALKAYIKARSRKDTPVAFETVKNGIERYLDYIKSENTPQKYIKQGSTWFNQQCWDDEYSVKSSQTDNHITTEADYDFSDWYKGDIK